MRYPAEFGRSGSEGASLIKKDPPDTFDQSRPAFQGHRNRHRLIAYP